jgi:outer membrane protein OmpA-like peptidoglycan-associated protein
MTRILFSAIIFCRCFYHSAAVCCGCRIFSTICFLIFTMGLALPLSAQMKRADSYFENLEYVKAIPFYEKGLKKKEDPAAAANLAYCYRYLKEYELAEKWYAKSVSLPGSDPINFFYYGQLLKNNNKPEEARKQFEIYILKVPESRTAKAQVKSCADLKHWLNQPPLYAVKNATQLNTRFSDFAPAYFNEEIVFTSDRGAKDLLGEDYNKSTNTAFLTIYLAKSKAGKDDSVTFKRIKEFPLVMKKTGHYGPVSFSGDRKVMAYNRVDKKLRLSRTHFVNRPKIYFANSKKTIFLGRTPFPFNSDDYSVAQPSLSADGKTLYFSSDMPGGYGGKDLYVSRQEGLTWTKPENLGPEVNTDKDEVFPCIRKDSVLFFSSDGHPGFGGLDVFSASHKNGKWGDITNQGSPLNGPTDDFGITFNEEGNRGYFSSDRIGGVGGDDIYSFQVTNKFMRVAGRVLLSRDGKEAAPNASVTLLTEDGQVVKVTTTDKSGFFRFDNLPADKKYLAQLDENDPAFAGKTKAWLTDEHGKIIRVTQLTKKSKGPRFSFHNLPADSNALGELYTADELINLAGNLLAGTDPAVPLSNQEVLLKNDKGEIVQWTTTNAFGAFAFKDIPPDQNYIVALEDKKSRLTLNTKITITNKSGREVGNTLVDKKGFFSYRILASDKAALSILIVPDEDLRVDIKGGLLAGDGSKKALANTTLYIMDQKGKVIQTIQTDAKGFFQFINLPSDQNYIVSVDEGADPVLAKLEKILLTDANGKVVREIKINKSGYFDFEILASEQTVLGNVYVDDPWLRVLQLKQVSEKDKDIHQRDSITIIENIYYAFGDWKILPEAENILTKVIQVMKNDPGLVVEVDSHTDSRSSSEFNLSLSNKRAKTVVDYIVIRGVPAYRIKGIGYGESRLLNRCADGVECSDDEHAKNRRTEFKITKKK